MRDEYDFSKAKRGAVIPSPGKTRITIMLDDLIIEHFRVLAEAEGIGYQTLINSLLRNAVTGGRKLKPEEDSLTVATLRQVIREEFSPYIVGSAAQPETAPRHEVLAALANDLSTKASAVTVPIYVRDRIVNAPKLIASGLLLEIGESRFLITAGHALDDMREGESAVPVNGGLSIVTGAKSRFCSQNSTKLEDDKFDVGVVRLSGSAWESVASSGFLTLGDTALRLPLAPCKDFAFIGYPATKQRRVAKNAILQSFQYRLVASGRPPASYEGLGYDQSVSVLLGFNKRRVWSELGCQSAPDLYGMSGGGVWCFGGRLGHASSQPLLAGIGIEWLRKEKDKVIVATRIDRILEAIVEKYPELGILVQEAHQGS